MHKVHHYQGELANREDNQQWYHYIIQVTLIDNPDLHGRNDRQDRRYPYVARGRGMRGIMFACVTHLTYHLSSNSIPVNVLLQPWQPQ